MMPRAEYQSWYDMKRRCYNRKNISYKYYGARGVKVCKRWLTSFAAFLQDMGPKPSAAHSLDRKNNNKDYTPANCRWATRQQQSENRRSNWNIDGLTLTEAARRNGLKRKTVEKRVMKHGWLIDHAISIPARGFQYRRIKFNGVEKTITEWARDLGVARNTVKQRLDYGWSIEAALTTPARKLH